MCFNILWIAVADKNLNAVSKARNIDLNVFQFVLDKVKSIEGKVFSGSRSGASSKDLLEVLGKLNDRMQTVLAGGQGGLGRQLAMDFVIGSADTLAQSYLSSKFGLDLSFFSFNRKKSSTNLGKKSGGGTSEGSGQTPKGQDNRGTGGVIDERAKNAGLDLTPKPSPYKQLGNKTKKKLEDKVNNRTITKEEWKRLEWNKRLARRRDAGVKEFWQQEKRRIKKGEPATRNWSQEQKEAILSNQVPKFNGKPITGHHAYSVSKYPHLANRGEIIYPVTVKEHLSRWHGGSYKRSLPGKPYDPSFLEEF